MPRRKRKGPATIIWRTLCNRCSAPVLWLPELEEYKRKWGPVNATPVPADRWTSEAEHDVRGFDLHGMTISGRRVDSAEEATRYVNIYTRHRCAERKPGRCDVPVDG